MTVDGVTRIVRMSFHKHGTRENTVKGPCVCERDESVTKEVNLYICMYVYIYMSDMREFFRADCEKCRLENGCQFR